MSLTAEEQKFSIMRIKGLFRSYFDGDYFVQPQSKSPLSALMITDLAFDFKEDGLIELTVTLSRPGLLIGKMGRTINALEKSFSTDQNPVKILIVESKLWS